MNNMEFSSKEIKLIDRSSISINGVTKLVSFDDEEFLMTTELGDLRVQGTTLELTKLDTIEGIVHIKGQINSITYLNSKVKEEGILTKLFK